METLLIGNEKRKKRLLLAELERYGIYSKQRELWKFQKGHLREGCKE